MSQVFKRMQSPVLATLLVVVAACASTPPQELPAASKQQDVLTLLGISPSEESVDYVRNKTQFQLHTLLTEQRHQRTWDLSERISQETAEGLRMLFSVDDDITARLENISREPAPAALSDAIEQALLQRRKIYIYGTGATGRLAKEMESTFWRPFWRRVLDDPEIRAKLKPHLSADIESELIGEMTGADRALISSLEGFEDLQLIGRLQLADHGIRKGDVVIEVTEGGETSAGIGTVLGALDQWKFVEGEGGNQPVAGYDPAEAAKYLFFVYNNPDSVLLPFERSRQVIEQPGITKLNLTTGPQAITGSTRMQATTIETFVIAHAVQEAVERVLERLLDAEELARLGFERGTSLQQRFARFPEVLSAVKATVPDLAKLTDLESETYRDGHFSTYFADRGLITVFIDSTERSPTFRLFPLDTINEARRKSWIQVWTPARDTQEAWRKMLGRAFRGLQPERYREPFATRIDDPYLRNAALESLKRAGDDQQALYDFSLEDGLKRRGPQPGDLGVMVAMGDESRALADRESAFARFGAAFEEHDARLSIVHVGTEPAPVWRDADAVVHVAVGTQDDPFGVDQQIALKMLLNAHSTAVMARLDKVVGNTMTNVSPSNLKLIGRATYLIQSHVNDVLASEAWTRRYGKQAPVTYAQANAVLFDTIGFVREKKKAGDQAAAEVSLAIVRILESLRLQRAVSYDEALASLKTGGLNGYLADLRTLN
jgi:N-acetylmuramic acid 6-phosphate etherase